MNIRNTTKDILFGVAVGDALGVPVEFKSRQTIKQNPVTDMIGFGTHYQPAGTWSDDSSLTFCLAETLSQEFDLQTIANNFIKWLNEGFWTAHGNVFDIGIATSKAISALKQGVNPILAGGKTDWDNGNGSLMRILPLVLYIKDLQIDERFEITKQVSSITHGHIRSIIACFYYLEFARQIINGIDKFEAYQNLKNEVLEFLKTQSIPESEINKFKGLLVNNIHEYQENEINSSGYVLHTLEASIWCVLTSQNYSESVLKAVNLGEDTDTTGAVTGGLAGLIYGFDGIPKHWVNILARLKDIEDLSERLDGKAL